MQCEACNSTPCECPLANQDPLSELLHRVEDLSKEDLKRIEQSGVKNIGHLREVDAAGYLIHLGISVLLAARIKNAIQSERVSGASYLASLILFYFLCTLT